MVVSCLQGTTGLFKLKLMIYKPQNPYRSIPQLPYCCVPATLQWILYRRRFDILDQESIGAILGLRLPLKAKTIFKNNDIVFTDDVPTTGYGTQIELAQYSIANFFSHHNLPLTISELIIPESSSAVAELLIKHLSLDDDMILRYNNKATRLPGQKSYGHFSVIAQFDSETDQVTIGDPEPPFFKTIILKEIITAISDKIDGIQRGFYIVSPKSKTR